MPCGTKQLVFAALSLVCVWSVRQKIRTESASAVQIVDAIGALIHRQHLGIRRISELIDAKATPGAEEAYVQSLKEVIKKTEEELEPMVKNAQRATQQKIDRHLQAVADANKAADGGKGLADRDDEAWFKCVAEELGRKQAAEDAQGALDESRSNEEEKCQLQQDNRGFAWDATGKYNLAFDCDHSVEGDCGQKNQAFLNVVNGIGQDAGAALEKDEAEYSAMKGACDDRKQKRVAAQSAKNSADAAWSQKRGECEEMSKARKQSICDFGRKVQFKCKEEGAFSEVLSAVDAKEGGDSEQTRMDEWLTLGMTKCMVAKSIEKGMEKSVDATDLEACESKVNFEEQVGKLDRKSAEFGDLQGSHACKDGPIKFYNGQTWTVPAGDDVSAKDYVRVAFTPKLSAEAGSAFELCSTKKETCATHRCQKGKVMNRNLECNGQCTDEECCKWHT